MAGFTVRRVEDPTEEQINASADLFCNVMHGNLGALSLSGGDPALIKLQALAVLRAGILAGEYYVAQDAEGELLGFTLWMPPGQEMFSTEEQRNLGLYEFMARLSDDAKEYYRTTYMARFPGFVNSRLGPTASSRRWLSSVPDLLTIYPKGKLDSWWLHMAMVRPEHQRQGIARALISLVREEASKSGETLACTTTSDDNIPVYTALGFTHLDSITMPSQWGEWPIHLFSLKTSHEPEPAPRN